MTKRDSEPLMPPKYIEDLLKWQNSFSQQFDVFRDLAESPLAKLAADIQRQNRFLSNPGFLSLGHLCALEGHASEIAEVVRSLQNSRSAHVSIWSDLNAINQTHGQTLREFQKVQEQISGYLSLSGHKVGHLGIFEGKMRDLLVTIESLAQFHQDSPDITSSALAATLSYQEFFKHQVLHLRSDNEDSGNRRLRISELAGGLAEGTVTAIALWAPHRLNVEQDPLSPDDVNLYACLNQYVGYVYRKDRHPEPEDAFFLALPTRISQLGAAIVSCVTQINDISERNTGVPVFKPTNRGLQSCAIIPTRIARCRDDFALVIDALFFILYEGSGTANRLTPITTDSTLEPLWRVKHLRLDARHDVDHGTDVRSKREKIRRAYEALIGKSGVTQQKEWAEAQLELYAQLLEMLDEILQSLVKKE